MKKLFLLLLAVSMLPAFVQASYSQNIEHQIVASQFGLFGVPSVGNGFSFPPDSCSVSGGGKNFPAFATGVPIKIVDTNPSHTEVVTPVAAFVNNSTCSVSLTPTFAHSSFTLTSGTGGLQEAINYSQVFGGANTIILDQQWYTLVTPRTAATVISTVAGNTTFGIVDVTTTPYTGYAWNGTQYVSVGTGGAVSSVFGRTGTVIATSGDYLVAQVTGAAPLASPSFTGTPTAPTQAVSTNNTNIATTAAVETALIPYALLSGSPTYYVDNVLGVDTNAGTLAAPFKTIAHVNGLTLAPGTSVLFRSGDVWRGTELLISASGTASQPITFGAYGQGAKPIISAAIIPATWTNASGNIWTAAVTTSPAAVIFNSTYGAVEGSQGAITAPSEWYWASGTLSVYSTSNPATAFTAPGIQVPQTTAAIDTQQNGYLVFDGLSIQSNNATYTGAIDISGSNTTLENSEVIYGISSGVRIAYGPSNAQTNILIQGNDIHGNFGTGVYGYQSIATVAAPVIIQNNTIHNNLGYGGFGDGIQAYANYWIIQNNQVYNNGDLADDEIAVHLYGTSSSDHTYGQNDIIRYNTISGQISIPSEDGSGIETDHGVQNGQIYSNTISGNSGPCIDIFQSNTMTVNANTCYGNVTSSTSPYPSELLAAGLGTAVSGLVFTNNVIYATRSYEYAFYADSNAAGNTTASGNSLYAPPSPNFYFWNTTPGNSISTFNGLTGVSGNTNANGTALPGPGAVSGTVSVLAYGALCNWNGSSGTDDSTAFQSASTAASTSYASTGIPVTIVVPFGCTLGTGSGNPTITVGSGVHWVGPGSIFVPEQSTNELFKMLSTSDDSFEGLTINYVANLSGCAPTVNNNLCSAIRWDSASPGTGATFKKLNIRNNTIINSNWGITVLAQDGLDNLTNVHIDGNTITESTQPITAYLYNDAIHVGGGVSAVTISHNIANGRSDAGIAITSENSGTLKVCKDITVTGNVLYQDRIGIDNSGCTNTEITGNLAYADIAISSSSNPAFRSIFYNAQSTNVNVNGNTFHNYQGTGTDYTVKLDCEGGCATNMNAKVSGNKMFSLYIRGSQIDVADNTFEAGGILDVDWDTVNGIGSYYVTVGPNSWQNGGTFNTDNRSDVYANSYLAPQTGIITVTHPGEFSNIPATFSALTDPALTSGDCLQASTGGLITSTGSPCGGSGGSPTGSAGGSLSGTYPNPGLATSISTTNITATSSLTDSALTSGDCLQAGSGGLITSTSGPCSSAGATLGANTFSGTQTAPNFTDSALTPGDCLQASTGGLLATTGSPCGGSGGSPTGSAGGSLSGTYPNPGLATSISTSNITASVALTDSALTSGNCVQASTGGLLTTTGAACGSGGGGGGVSNANFVFVGDSITCGSFSSTGCANLGPGAGTPVTTPASGYQAATTGTAGSGSTSMTVASATNIINGMLVVGAGIVPGTTGTISGTTVTLSQATTAALSTTAVSFGLMSYPAQAMRRAALTGNSNTGTNVGVSGWRSDQIISDYTTHVHPLAPSQTGKAGYLFIQIGTNDILQGITTATVEANLTSYWQTALADGWTVIAYTIPIGPWSQDQWSQWVQLNTFIRANGTVWNRLVDEASVLTNDYDHTYWNTDNLHPINAGYAILAQLTDTVIATNESVQPGVPVYPLGTGRGNYVAPVGAGSHLTTGAGDTYVGYQTGQFGTSDYNMSGFGIITLGNANGAHDDSAFGQNSQSNVSTGTFISSLGSAACDTLTTQTNAMCLGASADASANYTTQIGQGTNNTASTLQLYTWNLVDTNGNIAVNTLKEAVGSPIASASTIAPASGITHITGTTPIATITPPTILESGGAFTGCVKLIPDGVWTTTTGGNIALASTAVVSRVLTECYDGAHWYPSY